MFTRTPATTRDASALCDRVHRLYQSLALSPTLEPSATVDALFRELVGIVQGSPSPQQTALLADPILSSVRERLQELCAEGEFRLESHWAHRILDAPPGLAWQILREFPYYGNYERLARLELRALGMACEGAGAGSAEPLRVLFVGSGPLPLTSIVLATQHRCQVTNLDRDASACRLARGVADRLGIAAQLDFIEADVLGHRALDGYDVLFLAALVGRHRVDKRAILAHVARGMRQGSFMVARSAQRMRTLLYPAIELEDMVGLSPLLEIHPHDDVINSVIVARRESVPELSAAQ